MTNQEKWTSVSEVVPDTPRRVRVRGMGGQGNKWTGVGYYDDDMELPAWRLFDCPFRICKITHWAELVNGPQNK